MTGSGIIQDIVVRTDVAQDEPVPATLIGQAILLVNPCFVDSLGALHPLGSQAWVAKVCLEKPQCFLNLGANVFGKTLVRSDEAIGEF